MDTFLNGATKVIGVIASLGVFGYIAFAVFALKGLHLVGKIVGVAALLVCAVAVLSHVFNINLVNMILSL